MTEFYLYGDEVFTEAGLLYEHYVGVSGDRICEITATPDPQHPVVARGKRLLPGLIDLHVHGCHGVDVMDGSPEAIDTLSQAMASRGVTGFLGTTVTAGWDETCTALRNMAAACERQLPGAKALGIYSEGLFFTEPNRGAHNPDYFQALDNNLLSSLIGHCAGHLKIVALAAELEGAPEAIGFFKTHNVKVLLGHTACSYDQAKNALGAGACGGVHLFNGMTGLHHREPGCVGALLADDDAVVELIADGTHVHPAAMKLVTKAKGADKVALISDCIRAGGLADGEYELGTYKVTVKDGIARTSYGSLAGSTLALNRAVANMVNMGCAGTEQAVTMASLTPATLLDLDQELGSIRSGKRAAFTLVDDNWEVLSTWVDGNNVYQSELQE